jgi:cobalt-zinc-cadmium efflux system membrane fusion protein
MVFLLSILPLLFVSSTALAAEEMIRLAPEQVSRTGVLTSTLAELKTSASIRLPAQVVVPPAQVEVIAAAVPAMVASVRVAYGDAVKQGQILLRLQGGQLLELQREHLGARAAAQLAAENRRRDESLFADGIIAQSRLSATLTAERQAAALAAEKRRAMQLAGMAGPATDVSGIAELRAPFDGVVLEAAAQPGQRVDAMTPLLKLGRLAPLWLEIQASPAQAAGIVQGDTVSIAGCAQPGRVSLVAPQMQATSQSLLIRAELQKPEGCIRPFQYVQAEIRSLRPLAANTWRLPASALVRHQGQVWVFVEVAGGFRPVSVKLLDETPETALVAVGLAAETRLVVKGASTVKASWLGLGASEGK